MFDSYSAEAQGGIVLGPKEKQEKNQLEKMEEKQIDSGLTGQAKVGIVSMAALVFGILFFSGFFASFQDMKWMKAFDFQALSGTFGTIKTVGKDTFMGAGGSSAREGFLFAFSLLPSVMFALGCVEVLSHFGALRAAQKLMTPLLRPLMGVPGMVGLTLITDMQSTDAGAAMTKELYDKGMINKKEQTIIAAWQYSGAGMISNFFASGPAVFSLLLFPLIVPLIVIFIFKFIGAIYVRIMLNTFFKEDFRRGE